MDILRIVNTVAKLSKGHPNIGVSFYREGERKRKRKRCHIQITSIQGLLCPIYLYNISPEARITFAQFGF